MTKEVLLNHATPTRRYRLGFAALLALLISVPAASAAQAEVDEQAIDLLRSALAHTAGSETVQFDFNYTKRQRTRTDDNREQIAGQIAVARPGRLALSAHDRQENAILAILDGEIHYEAVESLGLYLERENENSLAELWANDLNPLSQSGGFLAFTLPLVDNEASQRFQQSITAARVVGRERVGDSQATRLRLDVALAQLALVPESLGDLLGGLTLPIDVWISNDEQPVVLRVMSQTDDLDAQIHGHDQVRARSDIRLSNWRFDQTLDEQTFVYEPLEGLTQANSAADLSDAPDATASANGGGGPQPPANARDAQQLIGQAAPNFQLQKLGGGAVNLERDHRGDVVVLDFWATWCGPCIRVMPIMQRISNRYADQDVYVYAVNLREDDNQVARFLRQHNLDLEVPMDRNGATGSAYKINAIPQSVVIGPDGTVQAVHIGARGDLEDLLREEIDTLLRRGQLN